MYFLLSYTPVTSSFQNRNRITSLLNSDIKRGSLPPGIACLSVVHPFISNRIGTWTAYTPSLTDFYFDALENSKPFVFDRHAWYCWMLSSRCKILLVHLFYREPLPSVRTYQDTFSYPRTVRPPTHSSSSQNISWGAALRVVFTTTDWEPRMWRKHGDRKIGYKGENGIFEALKSNSATWWRRPNPDNNVPVPCMKVGICIGN